ncbi:expressed unknown protein [Seminavis robusta]|uniref:Uncharacterized protein n=1 Tax=Seminavis robusta TaxID=568900 RepID=A0A9N8EY05_9STRA|nr:expressed unknown protein [Seminavis robusta]|eukprot:Sro2790_g337140.1 n/a (233) ;mRNA; f:4336-5034
MGGYKGPRKVSLGGIGRTPETDVLLTKVLASCPALEELEVYAFSPDSASIEVNHQSFVLLLQQVKVRKLFLSCDVDNDYNLENIFHPLKDNHFLEELSIDLRLPATVWMFDGGYTPADAISPTGWDWLCYSLCQVLCGILEESNMTLKKVGWCENGNSPSRLYKDAMDPARYLAALNFFGRGQVRRGECENIGDLLAAAKVEIMHDDTTYGFGFASIGYGLLRESPSLWAQV